MFTSLLVSSSIFFFFFKHKTAYEMRISDWSSDVCSSDLLREVDAREILALIHQHLRFVLEALDLLVDLAQRSRRGEPVLPIVGRVEHADLRLCRGARRSEEHPSELQSLMRISYPVLSFNHNISNGCRTALHPHPLASCVRIGGTAAH